MCQVIDSAVNSEQCCFTKCDPNSSVHQRTHMCNTLLPLHFKCHVVHWQRAVCSLVQGWGYREKPLWSE